MTKGKSILLYSTLVVILSFFLILALVKASSFLIPLVTAFILALLVLPLSRKMESGPLSRAGASLINTFILLWISFGFVTLISFQVKNIVDDWSNIKQTMKPKIEQLRDYILEHTPVNEADLKMERNSYSFLSSSSSSESQSSQNTRDFFKAVLGFFGQYLLTFIYIFFILNYRRRFREFLLRLFPKEKNDEVKKVIHRSVEVTQQYLIGKLVLIGILAVLYSIGLGFSGVDNFILISVLAAVLSLIPYIGNVIGFFMAMTFGYFTSGETSVLIGIIITFSIAQFVESYILEPYIVGDRVDLHPFFVILAVVAGNMIWGIMGMILSIPILAMINVVLLDIPALRPFGFLLSNKSTPD